MDKYSVSYNPKPVYKMPDYEKRIQSLSQENTKLRMKLRTAIRKGGWRKQVSRYSPGFNAGFWGQMLNLLISLSLVKDDSNRRAVLSDIVALCEYVTGVKIVPYDRSLEDTERSARYLLWEFSPMEGSWEDFDASNDEVWEFRRVGAIAATWLADLYEEDLDA